MGRPSPNFLPSCISIGQDPPLLWSNFEKIKFKETGKNRSPKLRRNKVDRQNIELAIAKVLTLLRQTSYTHAHTHTHTELQSKDCEELIPEVRLTTDLIREGTRSKPTTSMADGRLQSRGFLPSVKG